MVWRCQGRVPVPSTLDQGTKCSGQGGYRQLEPLLGIGATSTYSCPLSTPPIPALIPRPRRSQTALQKTDGSGAGADAEAVPKPDSSGAARNEPRLELCVTGPLELARKLERNGRLDRNLQRSVSKLCSLNQGIVSTWKAIEVSLETFRRLKNDWLNMDLIAFFLEWWRDRTGGGGGTENVSCAADAKPRCWYTNSWFFTKLSADGHDAVQRWVPNKVFQDYDKLIIPINDNNTHWYLAVVNLRDKRVEFYDSMRESVREQALETLLGWLEQTYPARFKTAFPSSEWSTLTNPPGSVPQQGNGRDCGVFTCLFAAYCSLDAPFNFSQADIQLLRHYMENVICGADWRPA